MGKLLINEETLPTALKRKLKRTKERISRKMQLDMAYAFSMEDSSTEYVPVLTEGMVNNLPYAENEIRLGIAKGAIETFLEKLPDDYKGIIKIGHLPYELFPVHFGTFTKDDFKVINFDGQGLKQLVVKPKWITNSPFYEHFKRGNEFVGFSPEFLEEFNVVDDNKTAQNGFEVLKEFYFEELGIVGETGFATSGGKLEFSIDEGNKMDKEMQERLDSLEAKLDIPDEQVTEQQAETLTDATDNVETKEEETVVEEVEAKQEENESHVEVKTDAVMLNELKAELEKVKAESKLEVDRLTSELDSTKRELENAKASRLLAEQESSNIKESYEELVKKVERIESFVSGKGFDTSKNPNPSFNKKEEQIEEPIAYNPW